MGHVADVERGLSPLLPGPFHLLGSPTTGGLGHVPVSTIWLSMTPSALGQLSSAMPWVSAGTGVGVSEKLDMCGPQWWVSAGCSVVAT